MEETITARIGKEWKRRMIIIVAILIGMGGWFLADGLFGYPASTERAKYYKELEETHGAETASLEEAWKKFAVEKGWPLARPKAYTDDQIRTQFLMAGLAFALCGVALGYLLWSLKRTTRLEGNTLHLPDGRTIPIESITAIDKKRWESRSIADLIYEPKPGEPQKFSLDDYKYAGCDQILEKIEKSVNS